MGNDLDEEVIRRTLEPDENPSTQVASVIADVEEREITDQNPIWGCVDGMLDNLFSDPPDPEAQVEITFSYEGYRITVMQDGEAKFVKTG